MDAGKGLQSRAAFALTLVALALAARAERTVVVFNEDCDNVMRAHWHADPKRYTREEVANYYSSIIDGGQVSHLFFNVNARCSAFPSRVEAPYWAALDIPGMEHPQWLQATRDLVVGQGVDLIGLGFGLCRKKGVSPWLSFRMNDIHEPFNPRFCLNVGFWKRHPELWIDPASSNRSNGAWSSRAFDYRKEAVHAHMIAYVREALERYDADGIELDWMRFEHHAPRAVARTEGARGLNAFTRKVKTLVAEFERRRGHRILVAARVDSDPESALNHGMDWQTWARDGLVDWLIACNFWDTVDFDLPFAAWSAALRAINPKVLLLPGLDCGVHIPGQPRRYLTVDEYAGWGDRMYRQGAKGVYVFNLFCQPSLNPSGGLDSWNLVTKEGFTPETVSRHRKSIPANAPRECVMGGWCK